MIFLLIIGFSILISSLLQNVNFNYYFKEKNVIYTLFWILICFLNWKIDLESSFFEYFFVKFVLFISLSICSLTDIFERAVYTIIPFGMILIKFIVLDNLNLVSNKIGFFDCIIIYLILKSINYFSKMIYSKDGIGDGDIFLLSALASYYSFERVLLILFLSSVLGCVWVLGNKIFFLFLKKNYNDKYICFVPFIMSGTYLSSFLINKFSMFASII